jgi:hypothetical protein
LHGQVVLSTMTAEQKQKAVNEARVMTQMDHMNVIKYLDSYEQVGLTAAAVVPVLVVPP